MDSTIVASIIGAFATILAVIIGGLLQRKKAVRMTRPQIIKDDFQPDEDSIYFMVYLLHEAYENSQPWSSRQLAEHHLDYSPLEVEVQLIELEKYGYVKRTSRSTSGLAMWQMLPKGVEFMFANGHQLDDLIQEQR